MWKIFAIFLASIVLLSSCQDEYSSHFYAERKDETIVAIGSGDFTSSGQIISFPNQSEEGFLIEAIQKAKEKIWVEIYTFTKIDSLYDELVQAKNRGVDVRILLEWNVYWTPSINASAFWFFQKNNIPVAYTDNSRYVFTHAKFWLIDNAYFISTGNWTKAFFSKNREYIYTDTDSTTYQFLQKIFLKDFSHQAFVQDSEIPNHIVISPLNSRYKIDSFLETVENEIILYIQTISDEKILQKIKDLQEEWKKVFVCTADNEANREVFHDFEGSWKFWKNPYLHAKIMLKNGSDIFLWSQNFTTNSLENNREMGIILSGRVDLYKKLRQEIYSHCQD